MATITTAGGKEFTSGETRHFVMGWNGELLEIDEETAKAMRVKSRGSAVVSRVDTETSTIWCCPPLPESLKVK